MSEVDTPYWFGFSLDLARVIAERRPFANVPPGWLNQVAELGIAPTTLVTVPNATERPD